MCPALFAQFQALVRVILGPFEFMDSWALPRAPHLGERKEELQRPRLCPSFASPSAGSHSVPRLSLGGPQTQSNPPASASQVLGKHRCVRTSSSDVLKSQGLPLCRKWNEEQKRAVFSRKFVFLESLLRSPSPETSLVCKHVPLSSDV